MRLIDADALERVMDLSPDDWAKGRTIKRLIDDAPTIDAVPVVHGHVVWRNRFMGGFVPGVTITDNMGEKHTGTLDTTHYELVPYCSDCGKELGVSSLAYCPNCGARMDAEEDQNAEGPYQQAIPDGAFRDQSGSCQ